MLIDRSANFPCPLAASHDFNKIVRADYGNPFYCKLAVEAREVWKSDPLYKSFYHESGMVVLNDTETGRKIIRNHEDLGVDHSISMIDPAGMKTLYGGLFTDTDYEGVEKVFINHYSGWAEATPAVRAVIEAAVANGVKYVEGDIESLGFNNSGNCTGAITKDGKTLQADKVILCTGAGTAKLLAQSDPHRRDLQSGDRITAAAVITGVVRLNDEQMKRFGQSPVFIHAIEGVLGIYYFYSLSITSNNFLRRVTASHT